MKVYKYPLQVGENVIEDALGGAVVLADDDGSGQPHIWIAGTEVTKRRFYLVATGEPIGDD